MTRRIMTSGYDTGGADDDGLDADFREALSFWASGVTLVAVRDDARVYALTASAFTSVSLEPPIVSVGLGAGAITLPFLTEGRAFGISILAETQRRLASNYADTFPVGASPFTPDGIPLVPGALAHLACSVHRVIPAGDHHLVLAAVDAARSTDDGRPLIYYRRDYRTLAG